MRLANALALAEVEGRLEQVLDETGLHKYVEWSRRNHAHVWRTAKHNYTLSTYQYSRGGGASSSSR